MRHRRATLEDLRQYPVGTVLSTVDHALGWRKTGDSKTDWERVVPHPSSESGWRSRQPPESGTRAFVALTKTLASEPMAVWSEWSE